MTYLTERQIKAHNNGERFKTWDFTDGRLLLNSKSKVLISTNMCLVRTLEKFLSCYNSVVPDVCTNMTDYTSDEILDDLDKAKRAFSGLVNFIDVKDLAEYSYDLIVTNPPYSTYTNSKNKKIVNPAQEIINKTSNYLSKDGQIVILCRSMDVGMLAKAGSKIRKSIIFESLHYSTSNFEFHNVGTSIVGIIGLSILSKENTNEKLKVYVDNTLISRSANQHFLPRVMRKEVISKESISLALKSFNSTNLNKFGDGDLYLWNGYATDKKANQLEAYIEKYQGLRLMSSNKTNKNWALSGSENEKVAFNNFLWSKLFICLADIEAQSVMHGGGSTSPFIKGCIPDVWRELNTDEKIYQHFNLTQEEVDFVENYQVQCYTK